MINAATGEQDTKPIHYFSIDTEYVYWNFFLDFGPLNLGHLYRYCQKLNDKLVDPGLRDYIIVYYSSAAPTKRTNAAYLICAWQILYLHLTPEDAFSGFKKGPRSPWFRKVEGCKPIAPNRGGDRRPNREATL